MQMRIVAVWLLPLAFILINWPMRGICSQRNLMQENQQSTLRPVVERIFSRKKRWMVFPKGTSLKFTVNVSKRLLAMYPKGFNFVLEAAVYYPMPGARIDLIPKRFRQPTTKAPTRKAPTPLYLVGIPGSLIKYRAKPATQPPKVQRIDQNVSALQWAASPSFNWPNHNSLPEWSKYSSPEYVKNYQWSPQKQQKYVNKYAKYGYTNKWYANQRLPPSEANTFTSHKWNRRSRNGRDVDKSDEHISVLDDCDAEYEPVYFEELEPFVDSPNYHSYRGRRELFHHFEGLSKILGIDMKFCILRAVCDSKRFLLPPDYSMVQDILRIIFTFPTINGLKDDYSRIMEADYQTCDAYTNNKCPFSLLDWLLNSKKSM